MKYVDKFFLGFNIILFLILSYFGYFIYRSFDRPDTIEYSRKDISKGFEYVLFKRAKNFFGGYKYYFGARPLDDESPFIMKYFPVLDTDKDYFDKIQSLEPCGNDTYVIVIQKGPREDYKRFNIFDKESQLINEELLEACKREQLR
ncbi:hypothetical protein [Leptospira koniambonensis]|uniref:hypothetical protein n=1 Tax=Leptospira koniambonensis TaxID=2484950 RepID=UPI003EBB1766